MKIKNELNIISDFEFLVGFDKGKILFEMLKSEGLNYDMNIILNVDDKIKHLSMSFIEGFFHEILINIGIKGIENKLIVNSKIPYLKNIILNNLI